MVGGVDRGTDAGVEGVLLVATAGAGVGAAERDAGAMVMVGSMVVVDTAGGTGAPLARAWPMLA